VTLACIYIISSYFSAEVAICWFWSDLWIFCLIIHEPRSRCLLVIFKPFVCCMVNQIQNIPDKELTEIMSVYWNLKMICMTVMYLIMPVILVTILAEIMDLGTAGLGWSNWRQCFIQALFAGFPEEDSPGVENSPEGSVALHLIRVVFQDYVYELGEQIQHVFGVGSWYVLIIYIEKLSVTSNCV